MRGAHWLIWQQSPRAYRREFVEREIEDRRRYNEQMYAFTHPYLLTTGTPAPTRRWRGPGRAVYRARH